MKNVLNKLIGIEPGRKLSLFWKYLLMMGVILLLSLISLGIIHQKFLNTLSEELLTKMQINLERDSEKLNAVMHGTITIPSGIEDTRFYHYMGGQENGTLELKYYPVLSLLRSALQKQLYLTSDAEETVLYLKSYNSLVGTSRYEPVAEDYLEKNLVFSLTDAQTVLEHLKKRNHQVILPMQEVKLNGGAAKECLTLIIQPLESNIAIMSIYSKETIMSYLGIDHMPEGTDWEISRADGQVLAGTESIDAQNDGERYLLKGELESFRVSVSVWIPKSYFDEMLYDTRVEGMVVISFVAVFGVVLAIWFSGISVKPIRKLIAAHGNTGQSEKINELLRLDDLLSSSKENEKAMRRKLKRQTLAKVFYGGVLSEEDEQQLARQIPYLGTRYQVAILHSETKINAVIGQLLEECFAEGVWTVLSQNELGFLFRGGDDEVFVLTEMVQTINQQLKEVGISCGVSAVAENISDLHIAIRQARVTIPSEPGCSLFQGKNTGSVSVSWRQHERLYQCIFNDDEDGAMRLVDSIVGSVSRGGVRETFYTMKLVLRSVAEEIGVFVPVEAEGEYSPNLSPEENIRKLELIVRTIFAATRDRKQEESRNRQKQIMTYIQQNQSDSELLAASVANHFGVPEKRVYETVRTMTHMTFKEYLTDLRMKKAAKLLYATKDGIAEVAAQCGYRNSSTFYRLFQEYYGMSPGEFRKQEVLKD